MYSQCWREATWALCFVERSTVGLASTAALVPCQLHSARIPPKLPAAPPSPRNAGIVDGPPGEKEGDIQKLLFVGNFDGAVDACFAVSALLASRPDCTSPCITGSSEVPVQSTGGCSVLRKAWAQHASSCLACGPALCGRGAVLLRRVIPWASVAWLRECEVSAAPLLRTLEHAIKCLTVRVKLTLCPAPRRPTGMPTPWWWPPWWGAICGTGHARPT